ncbi:unnamed protein product [Heterobilharzia americana]|nr:unnamed protein product [Heterobilharzia americana]
MTKSCLCCLHMAGIDRRPDKQVILRQSSSHLNRTNSSLSLQSLANDVYTENIQLDDLAAPNHGCYCFKLPPIRLKTKRLHHHHADSQSNEILQPVFSQGNTGENQTIFTVSIVNNEQYNPIQPLYLPNEPIKDMIQQFTSKNSTSKPSISSIKLDVPVLSLTNQVNDDNIEKRHQLKKYISLNKVHLAVKSLCKRCNWNCFAIRKQHTKQLKLPIWNIIWYFITTLFITVSISTFIQSVPNIYVFTDWNNSNYQELVNPPSLASYSISFWLILIYPIYLIIILTFRTESITISEMIMQDTLIVASDQPKVMKVIARCCLLSSLWQIFIHCYIRSLRIVTTIDCAAITAVLPCFTYLLSWIIVHRRFCALRVIAFIMASSGVILNIYSDSIVMWYKCLTSMAVITFSLFTVILKRISTKPSFGQTACFYFALGLFNIFTTWPIVLFTSILTSTETIVWAYLPWYHFIGIGVSYLGIIISMDMSCRKSKRVIRSIQPLCALPICIVYELFWMKQRFIMSSVQISSLVLITIACLLNAFPSSWQKHIARVLKKNRSPKSQLNTSKRSISSVLKSKTSIIVTSTGRIPVSSTQRSSIIQGNPNVVNSVFNVINTNTIRPLSAESIQHESNINSMRTKS